MKDTDAATWDNKRTSLETVKWLCEHHTYATSSEFSMTLINNSTEAYFCKLSLPYNTPKEEWPRLCQHMHPSYYVEAKVENEETVCTQGKSSGANNPQSRYSFPDFWITFATFQKSCIFAHLVNSLCAIYALSSSTKRKPSTRLN